MKTTASILALSLLIPLANAQNNQQTSTSKSQPIRMFDQARAKGRIPDLKDVKLKIRFESAYPIKEDQANPLDTAFIRVSYQPDAKSLPISAILRPQHQSLNLWESMLPKTGEVKISVVYVNKRKVQISEMGPAVPLQFSKGMNYKVTLDKDGRFAVNTDEE